MPETKTENNHTLNRTAEPRRSLNIFGCGQVAEWLNNPAEFGKQAARDLLRQEQDKKK